MSFRSTLSRLVAIVSCAFFLTVSPALAAIYLDLDGIKGEVVTQDYVDQIEVLSINHGGSFDPCGGKGALAEFTFTKELDKASVDMYGALANATVLGESRFSLVSTVGGGPPVPYQEYIFQNPILSSFSAAGTSNDRPLEVWSMSYASVRIRYTFYDGTGKGVPEEVTITPAACVGP